MVKMKTYVVKKTGYYKPTSNIYKLYAANWWDACEEFRAWALGWLYEDGSPFADDAISEIKEAAHPHSLWWDGWTYTIQAVN